ncbi:LysO family transporter [uncultured Acidaminococcus sp.]|jgi:uncharacterized membrane protein YkvI|uniref:LysO family transporter n=1 Tax=Acidaminococcus sp. TaxID=1872103 RepID=UPI0025E6389B|nr:LysO family transporter [uncultured Acidaminococcus sp.]
MLELMFTLALGIILGLSDRMTSSVSHALGVITKICLFIMIFCLAAKIGCDEAVIRALPLIGRNAFFLCLGGMVGSFCLMALVGRLHREAFTRLLSEGERSHDS